MSITNGYTTIDAIAAAFSINDPLDNPDLEAAVETASRQIDAHCGRGRKFWQDSTVVDRVYFPDDARTLTVDDISTLTGLVVKVDDDDDGTFETTLTINTDFIVLPVNAAAEHPVQPWTQIRLLDGALTGWSRLSSGRPYVQVTAKFGWSAIPTAVKRACLIQARNVFKAQDATFGAFQLSIDGQIRNVPAIDPTARAQLEPFVRYDEINDG